MKSADNNYTMYSARTTASAASMVLSIRCYTSWSLLSSGIAILNYTGADQRVDWVSSHPPMDLKCQ